MSKVVKAIGSLFGGGGEAAPAGPSKAQLQAQESERASAAKERDRLSQERQATERASRSGRQGRRLLEFTGSNLKSTLG